MKMWVRQIDLAHGFDEPKETMARWCRRIKGLRIHPATGAVLVDPRQLVVISSLCWIRRMTAMPPSAVRKIAKDVIRRLSGKGGLFLFIDGGIPTAGLENRKGSMAHRIWFDLRAHERRMAEILDNVPREEQLRDGFVTGDLSGNHMSLEDSLAA